MNDLPPPLKAHPEAIRKEEEMTRLGDAIAELSAQIQAATYRLLVLLREFDEKGYWNNGAARSCAHWLSWRCGIDLGSAREKVRVARALKELPQTSEALRKAEISYSKARAITRVATAENAARLLNIARHAPTRELVTVGRAWRRLDRLAARERAERSETVTRLFI